jgi:transposase
VTDAGWDAGRASRAELEARVVEQEQLIVRLEGKVAEQQALIEELVRRVNRNSGNSSMAPSSEPPLSRAERRRRAREAYKRSLRRSGGQPGHRGKTREMVQPERVDRRFEHLPERCGCGHLFGGGGSGERPGCRVLPCRAMGRGLRRTSRCSPGCSGARASGPPARQRGVRDPRLEGRDRQLDHADQRDPSRPELKDAIRRAGAVHLDETTWRLCGAQQWLWVAAAALAACYRIDPRAQPKGGQGADRGGLRRVCCHRSLRRLV